MLPSHSSLDLSGKRRFQYAEILDRLWCVLVIAAELTATTAADAADTFRKLTASEIKSKVSGMEIEDVGEHWAEQMGYNTWASLQGTQERAAICGDFAMLELEVAPIIRELRAGGIEVVAVHNHMFFEEPRVIFLHYWGVGKAAHLASVFRRALEVQKQAQNGETCCSA
jgi:Domain of Unknown Function (DUF1259)